MAAGERPCAAQTGEQVEDLVVRVRTIGDIISTGCIESPARTVDDIIAEIAAARVTERGSRAARHFISDFRGSAVVADGIPFLREHMRPACRGRRPRRPLLSP